LWPGEQDGTSIIKIENQPTDEFRSYIGFDNNGSTATGKHRAKLIFEKDNLLGLNDNLQLSILGNKQVKALAFHTSLPYGYWTMDLDHSLSQYYYSVSKTKINGIGNNHNITLSRLIHRNQTSKTIINTALSIKDAQREIFKIKAPLPKLVVGRIGSSFSQRIASGIITCSGNFSRGLTSFEAAKDHKPFTKTRPRAQFSKIDYQIGLNYHFANQIQFKSNFYGQRSFHALYDSEQFNLSDSSLVRGFGVQNISGNNGVALRNELHLKLPNLLNNIPVKVTTALQAFIFIDLGRAKSSIDNKANRLISVGLGLNAQLGNLTGNFTLAKPTFASRDISKRGVELLFNVLVKTF
jgi:hemolysin activation/secretion protein